MTHLTQLLRNSENWVIAVLGIFGTIFFIQTFSYRPSVALFPRLISIVLASLSFYQLGNNIRYAISGRIGKKEQKEESGHGLAWYWSLLITGIYFGLINLIGFILGTGAFLVIFPVIAGYRRWLIIVLVAVGVSILTEISFTRFLHVQLPRGLLFS